MISIDELRIKLLKLGTELGEFDEEVRKWNQWFIRQTEDFQKSKLSMRSYKAVLERYETFLNKKSNIAVTVAEITSTEKPDKKEILKPSEEEKNDFRGLSKKDIAESPTKTVSETPQKKEISKKTVVEKDFPLIDVKKEPERKSIRERQLEWSDIVSFGWLTILGSIIFVIVLILITLGGKFFGTNISIGLLVFAFLLLLAGIMFDVLRWKNFDFSALGAIIAYIGIVMIFCVPIAYTFSIEPPESFWFFWIIFAIFFVVGGAGARWSEYDTKIVDMTTMAIGYWNNYQKRAAIRKFILLLFIFLKGLATSIVGGIIHFPGRFRTFLGRLFHSLKLYIQSNIGLIIDALNRILHSTWKNIHWFGLLAIFGYILNSRFLPSEFYRNTKLIIIILFFFFLGILTSRSEKVVGVINSSRTIILKGAISAYSMLTGTRIKKEESIFCSRCLRGVHKIEFVELQHVQDRENPLCPYCGHENWVTVT